jgi:hypothetical protein
MNRPESDPDAPLTVFFVWWTTFIFLMGFAVGYIASTWNAYLGAAIVWLWIIVLWARLIVEAIRKRRSNSQ